MHIWNNHFISDRKLLLQYLVDGILWELDDSGKYQAILYAEDVIHEPRGVMFLVGKMLMGWEEGAVIH